MSHVVALYRYPVKGLAPESCTALSLLASGRVAGDRVLGVRFADTPEPDDAWSSKRGMLVLMNTPGLARLHLSYRHESQRLALGFPDGAVVEAGLDDEGRRQLADALAAYAESLDENPLRDHPEHLPLRIVGDGITPRYHDNAAGEVSMHGRGSLAALSAAMDAPDLSEVRFRSNIALDGLEPWEEASWVGKRISIGSMTFQVTRSKVRCMATHANPVLGVRDLPVMSALVRSFAQEEPTFAVSLQPSAAGDIQVGDEVSLLE